MPGRGLGKAGNGWVSGMPMQRAGHGLERMGIRHAQAEDWARLETDGVWPAHAEGWAWPGTVMDLAAGARLPWEHWWECNRDQACSLKAKVPLRSSMKSGTRMILARRGSSPSLTSRILSKSC